MRRITASTLALALALGVPAVARADAPVVRIVDVVQVTWPGAPAAHATAQDVANAITSDVIDRWKTISGGRIVFQLGKILPAVRTSFALPCESAGTTNFLGGVADAAYSAAGITDRKGRYIVEVAANPTGGCVWDGRGTIGNPANPGGALVLRDTAEPLVIAHELGHNLGLGHSNLETCSSGADGPWSACTAIEYGSATDLMSNNDVRSPLAAYHQWRLGWIPDSDVAMGNRDETITVHNVASQPVDTATAFTRAVFVRDKSAAYWVEYRTPDTATGVKEGLVIYRTDPPPAASVLSPIASDASDPTSMDVTTDIWMINLGDYRYSAGTGSPSLTPGTTFNTAFGGASISAKPNGDGTATITVQRNGSAEPGTPVFTDPASWRNADAPIITADLDDNGTSIGYFEAETSVDSTTSIVRVARRDGAASTRTYLTPISAPSIARLGDLPEGRYSMRLRAVNVRGVAGAWSAPVQVRIDRGSPIVTGDVAVSSLLPGRSVTVDWVGATDAGAGICSAAALNEDGWVRYGWHSASGDTPQIPIDANTHVTSDAEVFDCVGNGVGGAMSIDSAYTPAKAITRTGKWSTATVKGSPIALIMTLRANSGAPSGGSTAVAAAEAGLLAGTKCNTGVACTARLTTGDGTTVLLMGGGSAVLSIDGKRVRTIASATGVMAGAARAVATVQGAHTVSLQGKGFTLVGAQSVRTAWKATAAIAGNPRVSDDSLTNASQRLLAGIGFAQSDFADTTTVRPIGGGTGVDDATLDLCSASFPSDAQRVARRQVMVTRSGSDPYLFLSTETVRYSSAAAVRQALGELDAAETLCRTRGYAIRSGGVTEPYEFKALPSLPAGLRPDADRRIYWVQMGQGTSAMTFLIAYQFSGDVLNALYVSKPGAWSITDAELSRWLGVASVMAQRLDTAVTHNLFGGGTAAA